jgi:hypothetical protein
MYQSIICERGYHELKEYCRMDIIINESRGMKMGSSSGSVLSSKAELCGEGKE